MATAAQMRKLALAMADVEEKSHFGKADFRVAGKIFAGLSADEKTGNLKLTAEIQSTVLGDDSAFTPCEGAWGRSGWTYVELRRVEVTMLGELVKEAWRIIAPKTLTSSARPASPRRSSRVKR